MNRQQMPSVATQQTSATSNLHPHYQSATSIPPRTSSAPLPSPTAQRPQFLSSFTTSSMASAASSSSSTSTSAFAAAASGSSGQQPPQYQYQTTGQSGMGNGQQVSESNGGYQHYTYAPDRGTSGSTAQETRTYIDNFALVAEAAKRAQMAVLMRDIDGMDLT